MSSSWNQVLKSKQNITTTSTTTKGKQPSSTTTASSSSGGGGVVAMEVDGQEAAGEDGESNG